MLQLAWVLALIFSPPSYEDAEALRQFAPQHLTAESARTHATASKLAAWVFSVDKDLVSVIAGHESNFTNTITIEPGGKVSCGVMTPEPTYDLKKCADAMHNLVNGYFAGAEHLRGWYHGARKDEVWNEHKALLGYAGGYALIDACALGPVWKLRADGHSDDLCTIPEVFLGRALYLRRLRAKLLQTFQT